MVVTVWAVLVFFGVVPQVLAENFLALFAAKYHIERLFQLVVGDSGMAVYTVKPSFAARRAHANLRIEDVFAHFPWVGVMMVSALFLLVFWTSFVPDSPG
eukprot:CAMPEP_0177686708 /NCGR_PEP_ID=MMETSP0447-20121125/33716_1 /TAXON_ID=0 /ORGANISM="Stygamoeba regulata, Strain BSH-02190019" /LENGTH=99 /DNA_ID=CAMNT_0019196855 /DNA_START=111 /DNA_END=407 /DNA_ORIENTATION=-